MLHTSTSYNPVRVDEDGEDSDATDNALEMGEGSEVGGRLRIPSSEADDSFEGMAVGDADASKRRRSSEDVLSDGCCAYCVRTFKLVWLGSRMNVLLLLTPFAMLAKSRGYEALTFVLALLALCPFAERISYVTEDVASYTNDTLVSCDGGRADFRGSGAWEGGRADRHSRTPQTQGGLLNASFGNITELIVCIFALKVRGGRRGGGGARGGGR